VECVERLLAHTAWPDAEANDSELGWRQQLQLRRLAYEAFGKVRERHRAVLRRSDCRRPEVLDREPDFQRSRVSRELLAIIGEIHLGLASANVLEVFRVDAERVLQLCGILHQ